MSIRISEKHGVNPSLMICFWCRKQSTGVALYGRIKGDAEAPRQVLDNPDHPCERCKANMALGITIVEAIDGDSGPEFTGKWLVLKEDAAKRLLINNDDLLKQVLESRRCMMDPDTFNLVFPPEDAQQEEAGS